MGSSSFLAPERAPDGPVRGAFIHVYASVYRMTATVPVRLDKETLETLDLLVRTGLYGNRSEAIRDLMKRGIETQDGVKRLSRLLGLIRDLDSKGKLDFTGLDLERESR